MSFICLILSGAALLVNGLGLLGRIPGRDAGAFSLLIGTVQLVLAAVSAAAAGGDPAVLLGVSGVFLFGLTYAYAGLDALLGLGSAGLGWFCGLVALLALFYAASNLAQDPLLAVLWLAWAVLWYLFFQLLALGRTALAAFTGWTTLLTGPLTTAVPALLGLSGAWPAGWDAAGVSAAVITALFALARGLAKARPAGAAAAPAAVETRESVSV
ncbi:AmiS/UreI transporter [Arthrobacter sp. I2-34]|uniref:AmiS/UreI transporter n=1 Tax=Arthrobacter hankyongi TaxID=2904801 RepID=A0ABS9LDI1_9MICC|nr:AmiS/UreI family transporter [Arthrobacter hankyongi]MCG2624743.1 AmiS/UreI transporter [Arthrobacter hankyongi]